MLGDISTHSHVDGNMNRGIVVCVRGPVGVFVHRLSVLQKERLETEIAMPDWLTSPPTELENLCPISSPTTDMT